MTEASFGLVAIMADGGCAIMPDPPPAGLADIVSAMVGMYADIGFAPPWIAYLAQNDDQVVGGGAFVAPPGADGVEIAYFTLPGHENQGHAARTAAALVALARQHDPALTIWAKTMPAHNASTRILAGLVFEQTQIVQDHEIGDAWKWELPAST